MKKSDTEFEEVEAEWEHGAKPPPRTKRAQNKPNPFAAILAGILIDAIDVVTVGPLGMMMGAFVGGSIAYLLGLLNGLSTLQRIQLAIAIGIYCAFPVTNFVPAATIVATLLQFFGSKSDRNQNLR